MATIKGDRFRSQPVAHDQALSVNALCGPSARLRPKLSRNFRGVSS